MSCRAMALVAASLLFATQSNATIRSHSKAISFGGAGINGKTTQPGGNSAAKAAKIRSTKSNASERMGGGGGGKATRTTPWHGYPGNNSSRMGGGGGGKGAAGVARRDQSTLAVNVRVQRTNGIRHKLHR